ncbi:MAG: RDD family protein [Desulfobacteraceae bacterium]|nr:MAG: RDD family protein [Desulfobacteraceae bacterium]
MSWYYQDGSQEFGPISKTELQELLKAKRINGRTLVRNITMDEWRPLVEMVHGTPPVDPQRRPVRPSSASSATAESVHSTDITVCSQCGRSFPHDQVISFNNQVICAACKPMYVQRLKEGAALPGVMNWAGFWIRLGAKIIDGLILGVLQYAVIIPMGIMAFSSMSDLSGDLSSSRPFMFVALSQLIAILIPLLYNTFFVGRFAATPGKMACRLRVIAPDGGRISYMRALGRNCAELISGLILLIGYLMAAFDTEKRTLHDRICSTRVVHKQS